MNGTTDAIIEAFGSMMGGSIEMTGSTIGRTIDAIIEAFG